MGISLKLVSIRAGDFRNCFGANHFGDLDAARTQAAEQPGEVHYRLAVSRIRHRYGCAGNHSLDLWKGQPLVALQRLLLAGGGGTLFEPGGAEHRHQAGSSAHCRFDDGRLVCFNGSRKHAGRLVGRFLRRKEL